MTHKTNKKKYNFHKFLYKICKISQCQSVIAVNAATASCQDPAAVERVPEELIAGLDHAVCTKRVAVAHHAVEEAAAYTEPVVE
ncbi:unnamed protein product [Arctia plantaginis]|uniref:Uncharacterized protein n=1 Tax=Arctia plantaginis TaxID=874455 RepID=A0A8S0YW64_ARCPL|nr:unnamed protein product [Arctia plantaginis]